MVREARLLWDSSSIPMSDVDRLRRIERGDRDGLRSGMPGVKDDDTKTSGDFTAIPVRGRSFKEAAQEQIEQPHNENISQGAAHD